MKRRTDPEQGVNGADDIVSNYVTFDLLRGNRAAIPKEK